MKPWFLILVGVWCLVACSPTEQQRYVQVDIGEASGLAVSEVASAVKLVASDVPSVAASPASAVVVQAASASSVPAVPQAAAHKSKKIPIGGSEEFGNTTFYFPDSIKKEGKLYYVMTENRFKTVQKLPESGKSFLYSLIREAVDCERKLTDPVSVTHFSEKDEVVEKHNYPYPNYDSWNQMELEALVNEHPDAAFINAVCQNKK